MRYSWLVVLALTCATVLYLVSGCNGGESGAATSCTSTADCERFTVCDLNTGKCIKVPCTTHPECASNYQGSFCLKEDTAQQGFCSPIECGKGVGDCPPGQVCLHFICVESEPECKVNSDCKIPVEKCYNGQCKAWNYCERHSDCPSGECNLETSKCVPVEHSDIPDVKSTPDSGGGCDPKEFENLTTFLCAPCESDADCGCGNGKCIEISGEGRCSTSCSNNDSCPSGYRCEGNVCLPFGTECKGCIVPPGCPQAGQTCNFKDGACMEKVPWCGSCNFDFQCGFGSRCYADKNFNQFCVPECSKKSFSCPLGSGCQIREDGVYVCVPTGSECCYGESCLCLCSDPTPYCYEDPQTHQKKCVECINNSHCPPSKPVCNKTTFTCELYCQPPTSILWKDPETGEETCVECVKSTDCPPPLVCGTFKGDPDTYHKCYQP